ncbi:MAG: hypothetical protein Q4C96_00195 [Planctomycetia bacterium]|nr:hypothetical protein [Planctomycetia bacterium]
MTLARDIYGNVFTGGCVTLMARAVSHQAEVLTPSNISSVNYSIYLLSNDDPQKMESVTGYTNISLSVNDVLYSELQKDKRWIIDETGYNFCHTLTNSHGTIFTLTNRDYLVVYRFTMTDDPQHEKEIILRFRIFVI